jgi:cation:H+ antiporter
MVELLLYVLLFIICCAILYAAGDWVVNGLSRIAKFLGWKEFAVAFFLMAAACTLPNLFLAIIAIINHVPELSVGDVVGGNVVDMTLTIALAVFFSKKGIDAHSHTIQTSAIFTSVVAVLPLILFMDGNLGRVDGLILLAAFFVYAYWLLSKKEHFKKVYNNYKFPPNRQMAAFIRDLMKVFIGCAILLAVAQGIVMSANVFSYSFKVSLPLVGILIVALGNCFPEAYFSIVSARNNETKMILGDLMGSIIMPGTLVLGLVALISPVEITNIAMFNAARYYLLVAAVFFYIAVRTDKKVTKREAAILLFIYIAFLLTEVFVK